MVSVFFGTHVVTTSELLANPSDITPEKRLHSGAVSCHQPLEHVYPVDLVGAFINLRELAVP